MTTTQKQLAARVDEWIREGYDAKRAIEIVSLRRQRAISEVREAWLLRHSSR